MDRHGLTVTGWGGETGSLAHWRHGSAYVTCTCGVAVAVTERDNKKSVATIFNIIIDSGYKFAVFIYFLTPLYTAATGGSWSWPLAP